MFSTKNTSQLSSAHIIVVILLTTLTILPDGVTSTAVVLRAERSDDGGPLEVLVQQLTQQVNSLTAQQGSLNSKLAAVEARTANLEKTIAFLAWGSSNPTHTAAGAIVVLDHATTNVGNAYDSLTGVFTVPVSGLYDFQISMMGYRVGSGMYNNIFIYVDNVVVGSAVSDSGHGYHSQSTARAIVRVNAGQRVYIKNVDNFDGNYYGHNPEPSTTFMGVLVKAD